MMPPSMEGGGAVGRTGDGVDVAAKGGFDVQSLIDPSTDATITVS